MLIIGLGCSVILQFSISSNLFLQLSNKILVYLSETNRNMETLTLRVLIPLMHAMEELLLCSIVSIGWRAAHGMDAMGLLSALTVL